MGRIVDEVVDARAEGQLLHQDWLGNIFFARWLLEACMEGQTGGSGLRFEIAQGKDDDVLLNCHSSTRHPCKPTRDFKGLSSCASFFPSRFLLLGLLCSESAGKEISGGSGGVWGCSGER